MTLRSTVLTISTLLFLTGCATGGRNWQPTVDAQASRSPETISKDTYECQQIALTASGNTGQEVAKGAVAGGAIGAASGAAIGAATGGNVGKGAAVGATIAGIGGMFKQGMENESQYRSAYRNCMLGRGHNVVN